MVPIRGGNWNNGANAGVFYLNLNNARSNSNTNIGARPDSVHLAASNGMVEQREALSGKPRLAKSAYRRLSGRQATSRFERQAALS